MARRIQPQNWPASVPKFQRKRRHNRCTELIIQLLQEFSEKSSIHGVDRALNRHTSGAKRVLWVFAFTVALTTLILMCMLLAARYNRQQFVSVIADTRYPIFKVPFPEITICNRNRLNWSLLPQAIRKFLRSEHRTPEYTAQFAEIVTSFDSLNFAEFDVFENLSMSALEVFNYVNYDQLVRFMSWRCEDLFAECEWEERSYNCCEIFFPRKSLTGRCLAFNTVESTEGKIKQFQDNKWPWRTTLTGPNSGLGLKINLRDQLHSPYSRFRKGIEVMVVEPNVWYDYSTVIEADKYVRISIEPIWHFFDNSMRQLSSDRRGCVFEGEFESADYKTLKGHKYMWENCQADCQQNHLIKYCNCTISLFYPLSQYPVCKLTDLPCLGRHNSLLQFTENPGEKSYVFTNRTGMTCDCLLNCFSLNYMLDIRKTWLPEHKLQPNTSVIDIKFFFRKDHALVFETHLVYTWIDLLVSFGGIAGLCLGSSVISLIEIFYFWLIDVPKLLFKECQSKRENSTALVSRHQLD